jgi:hypothetical protein
MGKNVSFVILNECNFKWNVGLGFIIRFVNLFMIELTFQIFIGLGVCYLDE